MSNINKVELIQELKKVKGSLSYDGDASVQVLLPTDKGYLRVGMTDDDVAAHPGEIWFDYYEGLNNEIKNISPPPVMYTEEEVENIAYMAWNKLKRWDEKPPQWNFEIFWQQYKKK